MLKSMKGVGEDITEQQGHYSSVSEELSEVFKKESEMRFQQL